MASALAHELNQPLTAIANFAAAARALWAKDPQSEQLANAHAEIESSAQRAGEIIRRLRSMTKRENGNHSAVLLAEAIREAGDLALTGTQTAIDYDIPDDLIVEIDRIQLQQVIVNLVRNAHEAMEGKERGTISIAAQREAAFVQIRVRDEGDGIPEDLLPTIFNSFVSTKKEGMGIGLSISRTIIEAHGGEIGAISKPGEGTTFWINLPLGIDRDGES